MGGELLADLIVRSVQPISDGEVNTSSMAIYGLKREDCEALEDIATIDRVLPLAEAQQAHELLESSTHFGKVVLQVREEEA